jgi:soluble lytic murein transglycosylase-like protein
VGDLSYVPDVFYDFVVAACVDYGVPLKYFAKLLWVESGYDPLCTSGPNDNGTYDLGIAQLNSRYIEEFAWRYDFGTIDPFNPLQAIRVAAKHLSVMYKHTGDWRSAFAAYNAGLSRVKSGKWPARTIEYVNKIFEGEA